MQWLVHRFLDIELEVVLGRYRILFLDRQRCANSLRERPAMCYLAKNDCIGVTPPRQIHGLPEGNRERMPALTAAHTRASIDQ